MRRVILFVGCIFFLVSPAWAATPSIVITEIGAYEKSGYEWVEIFNLSSEPVDLVGWKFWEGGVSHRLQASSTDSLVEPGEYAVVVQDENKFRELYPQFSGSIFDSSWSSLKEAGEEIGLQDVDKNFIEKFVYIKAPKFSLQRKDFNLDDYSSENWQEHNGGNSVGRQNIFIVEEIIAEEIISTSTLNTGSAEEVVSTTPVVIEPVQVIVSSTSAVVATAGNMIIPELVVAIVPEPISLDEPKQIKEPELVVMEKNLAGPKENITELFLAVTTNTPIFVTSTDLKKKIEFSNYTTTTVEKKDIVENEKITKIVKPDNQVSYLAINQVRNQPSGKKVRVSGLVSVLPGILGSQFLYIQDQTGGIQIYQYKKDFPVLQIGDQVFVSGEISESRGQKRIKVESSSEIKVEGVGLGLEVASSSIPNLADDDLGRLVKIEGVVVESKGSYLYIDDGLDEIKIYLKTGAKIGASKYKVGQSVELIGILEQSGDERQLWPRNSGDIKVLVGGVVGSSTKNQVLLHQTNSDKEKAKKTLVFTASGVSSILLGFLAKAKGVMIWENGKKVVLFIAGLIKK